MDNTPRTARDFLHLAAKAGGELQNECGMFQSVFLGIQTAIDALDAGKSLDEDIFDFVSDSRNLNGFKNYQKVVGVPLLELDLEVYLANRALGKDSLPMKEVVFCSSGQTR